MKHSNPTEEQRLTDYLPERLYAAPMQAWWCKAKMIDAQRSTFSVQRLKISDWRRSGSLHIGP